MKKFGGGATAPSNRANTQMSNRPSPGEYVRDVEALEFEISARPRDYLSSGPSMGYGTF